MFFIVNYDELQLRQQICEFGASNSRNADAVCACVQKGAVLLSSERLSLVITLCLQILSVCFVCRLGTVLIASTRPEIKRVGMG